MLALFAVCDGLETLRVRISGDGRDVSRHNQQTMICFSILNEKKKVLSPFHTYTIALIEDKEDYGTMKAGLEWLRTEMESINNNDIRFDGVSNVVFYMSGDMKWLLIVWGRAPASHRFGCFCCIKAKGDLHHTTGDDLRTDANTRLGHNGQLREPIFQGIIPLENVVVDSLHLFLRVVDILQDLLVSESVAAKTTDKLMAAYAKIGVPFTIGKDKDTQKMKYTKLMGNYKYRVLLDLDVTDEILPDMCVSHSTYAVRVSAVLQLSRRKASGQRAGRLDQVQQTVPCFAVMDSARSIHAFLLARLQEDEARRQNRWSCRACWNVSE